MTDVPPGATAAAPADEDWQRLHPLSPLLRGGVVLLAVLGYAASRVVDRVLPAADGGPSGGAPDEAAVVLEHPLLALAALLLVIAGVATVGWVSWRFSRFRVARGQLELRSGVLYRQHRQVPLERVQAVETTRPLLARLLGLSQVVVQSAGGADSHLTLAYLGAGRAEEVRAHLLDLAGRADERGPGAGAGGGGAPATPSDGAGPARVAGRSRDEGVPVLDVPNGRLFVATLLHPATLVLGLVVLGLLVAAAVTGLGAGVLAGAPALVPVVFGLAVGRVKELLVHGNFALSRTDTALRVRHGLTELRASSVPLHRVQAVEALQPLWWRPFGWWRVRVNVAGVRSDGSDGNDQTTLLPVGTLGDALRVLATLGVRPDDPFVVAALEGDGGEPGWVGPPRAARVLDPWSWRRSGYAVSDTALHLRSGRWSRSAVVVPHARVQSLALEQGPVQARLGLATGRVVSTPGPVSARAAHLRTGDAEAFLALVGARAREARRAVPAAGPRPGGSILPPDPAETVARRGTPLVD
ncbi:PH domain-containing protein [Nostocoides sp. Soil756]|uniref:PH domain-containing protein n=1 Tax=Nostocoides sp. Soil756 TaxID=1736399 RepID=UPI0006F2A3BC|nr:PH domain-containing protein [Tetrasphaera sp. Soil756]KRE62590.1 hypothetical protein ASG78_06135 [Tetrasphaera sp. Soil756]